MIQSKLDWQGEQALGRIVAASWEALARAVVFFWQKCVEAVGFPNPKPYRNPAPKGEPPRKRTGYGQRNVLYELNKEKLTGRVGFSPLAKYMGFLELKDHSWLRSTLKKFLSQIAALAGGGKVN